MPRSECEQAIPTLADLEAALRDLPPRPPRVTLHPSKLLEPGVVFPLLHSMLRPGNPPRQQERDDVVRVFACPGTVEEIVQQARQQGLAGLLEIAEEPIDATE